MTITEFLTARLDEDEAVARAARGTPGSGDWSWWDVDYQSTVAEAHGMRWAPDRVLADVAAKRAIVAMHGQAVAIDAVLDHLALPYAEHPDWRDEWRP